MTAPARQPHPQRCETCTNQEWTGRDLSIPDCKKCDHTPTSGERRFVEQMGCATHTSPPAPVSIKMRMPPDLEEFWLREHDAQVAKAAREQVLDELRQIKQYDRIYYRTPERGKARCKVESVSTNGKRIGISYCSSSFGNGCGISKGIDLSEVVSVCREIPLRSTKEP